MPENSGKSRKLNKKSKIYSNSDEAKIFTKKLGKSRNNPKII